MNKADVLTHLEDVDEEWAVIEVNLEDNGVVYMEAVDPCEAHLITTFRLFVDLEPETIFLRYIDR